MPKILFTIEHMFDIILNNYHYTRERSFDNMLQTINIPIQMFCVCSTVGDFTPVRFRYENEEHLIETVKINQVLSHKDTIYNGVREIQYTCEAEFFNELKLFIITYNINSHKWRLYKMLF